MAELLVAGMRATDIGEKLGLKVRSVRNYLSRIYDKLGVPGRTEAVIKLSKRTH